MWEDFHKDGSSRSIQGLWRKAKSCGSQSRSLVMECNGSVRFWSSQTSARPCISLEEIPFAIVTVVLLPCLSARRTNHVETARQNGPRHGRIQGHWCGHRERTGRVGSGGRGELRNRSERRGGCGDDDNHRRWPCRGDSR